MKRIKYLGVLLSIVTLCVACEKSEKDGLGGFHKNFVELYVDGQIMLTEFQNECSGDAHRLSKKQIAGFVICIPSPKMYFFYGPDIEKFNRWAARNNDIDFNQVLANGALPMVATFADNFSKMVVTSNADWDEAHPAGTSLDDVLQVRINSSSDFVHDGYDMGEYKYEFLQNHRKASVGVDCCRHENGLLFIDRFQFTDKIPCNRLHQCPDARKRAYADASLDDRRGRCQDCLGHLHAGGRSCVAINSRQEQHNIRSNFNTG